MSDEHKQRWSYSRCTSFGQCKYEYYLNYIINDDEQYLREGNYYAEVGSFVHKILEMIFKGELTQDDALQYYLDNYKNNVLYKVKNKSTMDKTYALLADFFASIDLSWVDNYEILGVEKKMKFTLDGFDFIGYIDLLLRDKRDGKIVVLDHKSTEYPFKLDGALKKKLQDSFSKYKKQMYLYAYAVYEEYDEYPKDMTWHHFKDGGKLATIPFKRMEYVESLDWFRRTLREIEREEDFEPNEDFFYCSTLCNFRKSCEYHKRSMRKAWKRK